VDFLIFFGIILANVILFPLWKAGEKESQMFFALKPGNEWNVGEKLVELKATNLKGAQGEVSRLPRGTRLLHEVPSLPEQPTAESRLCPIWADPFSVSN
jgi:hypothetical protein